MEVKMADLLHHHRFHPGSNIDVPTRIYLAAGLGLTLLAAVLIYAMMTSSALDHNVPLPMLIPGLVP
jgi:hypothetical protein